MPPARFEPANLANESHRPTLHTAQLIESLHKNYSIVLSEQGTAVAQWLRCCSTNRKVGGSIPAGVIGIF